MNRKKTTLDITPNIALLRMMVGILATWLLIGLLLFMGAGRLNWGLGWLFFAMWGLLKLVFILLLRWYDPELMVERATHHENTKPYERLIVPLYFLMSFGSILVAGLDGGRFRWSGEMPVALIIIAYIIYLFGNGLASWAVIANPFFSSESRLQVDRDQKVIRYGPYRFVRHPGYLAAILIWPVTGLLLESWWTVIPGLLAATMMFIRTVYEDRMLQAELTGYMEYTQQVRYRLFPGIW
ncbi:MAG TPA: isoprenylcysteine carboxylmethyltransferase family protein [Anaerolineae bacterium]|nr:isoprenylcysteine carboxylmethyltransferase family protein [Anaerolineae bacterium]